MRAIIATPNEETLTFTLDVEGEVYETAPMSPDEFEDADYNTSEDWEYFLRNGSYERVK